MQRREAGLPAVLGTVLAVLVALLLPAVLPGALPAAAAHDTLLSSDPAAESSLEHSPEQFQLEYSSEPLDLSPVVQVATTDGEEIEVSAPVIDGTTVTVDVPPLTAGDYEVQWRVVSSDGHPIEGTIPFTVTVGAAETAPAPTAVPSATAAPTTAPAAEPTPVEQQDATAADDATGGRTTALVLGGIGLLLVIGLIILAVTRPRGSRDSEEEPTTQE